MKKRILISIIASFLLFGSRVQAQEYAYQYPAKVRATCYTASEGSVTYSGEPVRKGILAGRKEWLGKVAVLYDLDLNVIGYYEFKDTGSHPGLNDGTRIDVFVWDDAEVRQWQIQYGDFVIMQIFDDAEG